MKRTKRKRTMRGGARPGAGRPAVSTHFIPGLPSSLLRFHSKIAGYSDDRSAQNGIWVYLKRGWIPDPNDCVHQIHCNTIGECAAELRELSPCDCNYCKGLED